jgi:uncharacterized membrane protein YdfJ with MMPL/SSD domain
LPACLPACGAPNAQTPALNEIGFILAFSVLFDTFVMRSLVVPSIMGLLGRWNWWPRRFPAVKFDSIVGIGEAELLRGPPCCH